jgi:hypothetical protein
MSCEFRFVCVGRLVRASRLELLVGRSSGGYGLSASPIGGDYPPQYACDDPPEYVPFSDNSHESVTIHDKKPSNVLAYHAFHGLPDFS